MGKCVKRLGDGTVPSSMVAIGVELAQTEMCLSVTHKVSST